MNRPKKELVSKTSLQTLHSMKKLHDQKRLKTGIWFVISVKACAMKIVGPRSLERQSTFYAKKTSKAHAQFVPVKSEDTVMPKLSISANKKKLLPTKLW